MNAILMETQRQEPPVPKVLLAMQPIQVKPALRSVTRVRQLATASDNRFSLEGKVWRIAYEGHDTLMPTSIGLRYIHRLLRAPNESIPARRLVADLKGRTREVCTSVVPVDAAETSVLLGYKPQQEVLSQDARRRLLVEMDRLREEIATFRRTGNTEALVEAEDQLERIEVYLSRSTFQGRSVGFATQADRDRRSVAMALRRAIQSIESVHAPLSLHLGNSIRTGSSCCYRPERPTFWSL